VLCACWIVFDKRSSKEISDVWLTLRMFCYIAACFVKRGPSARSATLTLHHISDNFSLLSEFAAQERLSYPSYHTTHKMVHTVFENPIGTFLTSSRFPDIEKRGSQVAGSAGIFKVRTVNNGRSIPITPLPS
jgi:hypothetical protein